jgi:hypothetical protein
MNTPPRHSLVPVLLAVVVVTALAGCSSGREPPVSTTSVTSPPTASTATLSTARDPKQAVLDDYLTSWEVYADALRRLDPSALSASFADASLRTVREEVAEQKAKNEPVYVDVTHHPQVIYLQGDQAIVLDDYENRSVTLEPGGGKPPRSVPAERVRQRRSLRLIDGRWKVTSITEEKQP